MLTPPLRDIAWPDARRIVSMRFPPVSLFDDLVDPSKWEAVQRGAIEGDPVAAASMGRLDLVPIERRVKGEGGSWRMTPFVHVDPAWAGRFHDGTFGAFYAAKTFETALAETIHHVAKASRAAGYGPGWRHRMRELVLVVNHEFHDLRGGGHENALAGDDYGASQKLAASLRSGGSNGIVYPSVRDEAGQCLAAFWPDVIGVPREGRLLSYHFDGHRMDLVRDESVGKVFRVVDSEL